MIEILPEIISVIVGGTVGWFFTRKKQEAEVKTNELENVAKGMGIYREFIDDLKGELDQIRQSQKVMRDENNSLVEKVDELKELNDKLSKEIRILESKVQKLTTENKKLIDQLKKDIKES